MILFAIKSLMQLLVIVLQLYLTLFVNINKEIILSLCGNVVADYQRFQGRSCNQKKQELLTNFDPKFLYSDSGLQLIFLLP